MNRAEFDIEAMAKLFRVTTMLQEQQKWAELTLNLTMTDHPELAALAHGKLEATKAEIAGYIAGAA